jgi:hypothetical protein
MKKKMRPALQIYWEYLSTYLSMTFVIYGLYLPMYSVPITTKVVNLFPSVAWYAHYNLYKVCWWHAAGWWISVDTSALVSFTNANWCHDTMNEILLKGVWNNNNSYGTFTWSNQIQFKLYLGTCLWTKIWPSKYADKDVWWVLQILEGGVIGTNLII